MTTLGKKKNCSKATSYSCGNSCINMQKVCRVDGLKGQAIEIASQLKATISATKPVDKPSQEPETEFVQPKFRMREKDGFDRMLPKGFVEREYNEEELKIKTAPAHEKVRNSNIGHELDPEVERRIKKEVKRIYNKNYESTQVFNKEGVLIFEQKGGESHTPVPTALSKGSIFIHNHPSGSSFSTADAAIVALENVSEVRAYTPEGGMYRLVRPEQGWSEDQKKKGSMDRIREKHWTLIEDEIIEALEGSGMEDSQIDFELENRERISVNFSHQLNKNLFKNLGADYYWDFDNI